MIYDKCPFFDEEKKECEINDIKPLVCKQFPFTESFIKTDKEYAYFYPCSYCYPYLLGLYIFTHNPPEEDKKIFEELKEKIGEEKLNFLRETIFKDGLKKLERDDIK